MPLILTLDQVNGASDAPVNGGRETRTLDEGRLTIGRGPGSDWVLADPQHHLSRTHCVIAFVDGSYVLTDLSTNGVFINGAAEPLSPDRRLALADGDEIRLGNYRITVAETLTPVTSAAYTDDSLIPQPGAAGFAYPFAAQASAREDDPFDRIDQMRPGRCADPEDDLFRGAEPLDVWQGPSQPDNADAPLHALAQPRFVAASPLDDSGIDALLGDTPPGEMAHMPCPAPAAPPPARPAVSAPPDAARPPAPARPAALAPPPAIPAKPPAVPAPPPADATPPCDAAAPLAQFLEGAGIRLDPDMDPQTVLRTAGEVFRAMVEGLRAVLMSRAAIKREFRADQTMLRAADNNPLKFSVTAEEAIAALLRPGRSGYLQPLAATSEAFADLKAHELAVMAGLQTALSNLLRRLNPNTLEEQHRAGPVGSLLPLAHKARCWEQYRTTYKEITREAEDSFTLAFGRDFARAYEQQARRL
jgi:type VI secretion system protein